jgi:uncharacterized protein (TIGR03083 family)
MAMMRSMMSAAFEWSTELTPLDTSKLFRPLLRELLELLQALEPGDWERPTMAGAWRVRDVAAHLLDGDLRRLAASRDDQLPSADPPIRSAEDLPRFINALNATGVAFGKRLSPRLLVDLLEITGDWIAGLFERLPLHEPAIWAVSWAGERESANWMDIGRDYTERWHHQMQIRDAVGEPRLLTPRWMEPLLDLSVRALPVAYANHSAPEGACVSLEVFGPTRGVWSVVRDSGRFRVLRGRPEAPDALVRIAADDAWRIFYNAVQGPDLVGRIEVQGNRDLAQPLLSARSVVV